ncbi:MAG: signal peptidase II [bacterium]|nr:signal peptidase II [bacterium]
MSRPIRHPAIVFASITVILDLIFKYIALQRLPEAGSLFVKNFVSFGLHKNEGIAFNIPVPHTILFTLTVVLLFFLGLLAYNHKDDENQITTGAIITIIGALANFFDRVVNGFTTDYILFANGSVINLADIVIVIGILTILFSKSRHKKTNLPTALD